MTSSSSFPGGSRAPGSWPAPTLPGPDPDLVVSTVDLVGEPSDYARVAQAWEDVHLAVERAQAMETLAEEHRVRQQAYQAEHRRAEDLQHRVDDRPVRDGPGAPDTGPDHLPTRDRPVDHL